MLGIVSANGARLNAGSVGLSMARRWSEAGRRMLFIDAADTTDVPLAKRFGAVVRAEFSPEARGLPSLVVAREPLTLKLVANHSYNLDGNEGSRWALFAPSHPEGMRYTNRWLADRFGELREIDRERSIILASSLQKGGEAQIPLLKALPTLVILAPMRTREDAEALRSLCEGLGLLDEDRAGPPQRRFLVIDGDSTELGDNEAMGITKFYVEGRLPHIEDEKLLRLQGSRKDRAFIREFDKVSERLMQLSDQDGFPVSEVATAVESTQPTMAASASYNYENATTPKPANGAPEAQDLILNPVASELEG